MRLRLLGLVLAAWLGAHSALVAGVRIKDITELEGARSNQLVGIGLVVGLEGTGGKSSSTQQMVVDMLQRFNITTSIIAEGRGASVFKSGNVSAVMVTAELGPFTRKGSRIDVTVSALDDATSLFGGQLIFTQLKGADNIVYALASGQVIVGGYGFAASGGAGGGGTTASVAKNHPTVGHISGGGIVECEARGRILRDGQVRLMLREPDYITARAIAKAINTRYPDTALTLDAGTVQVFVPDEHVNQVVGFVGDIGLLEVNPDTTAKVIIDERTGTVVAGDQVKVGRVAIVRGNLAISVSNEPVASQPAPYSRGKTVVLPRASVGVTEQGGVMQVIEPAMTVSDLARALNALGATPRDLVIVFEHIKKAGALHAELVVLGR